MSENDTTVEAVTTSESNENADNSALKLNGLFAFKVGMSTIFDEAGNAVPVTVLRQGKWIVSQVKTKENDGYVAIQLACRPKAAKNSNKSKAGHYKKAGMPNDFEFVGEMRVSNIEGIQVGATVDIGSLQKGDLVNVVGHSKGRGFQGSVKRWGFAGGPASHGSKFHRQPGSSGNRTWPGRIMPGKKFPGHMGDRQITLRKVQIVDVLPNENVLLVKGPVPGAPNSLVRLTKES